MSYRSHNPWFRRLFRFRLRTLLVLTGVVALPCAYLGKHLVRQAIERPIVNRIAAAGGQVAYDYQIDPATNLHMLSRKPPGPKFVRSLFGDNVFASVRVVWFLNSTATDVDLADLHKFTALKEVALEGDKFTDRAINYLLDIHQLTGVNLTDTAVSPVGFVRLAAQDRLKNLTLMGTNASGPYIEQLPRFRSLKHLQIIDSNASNDSIRSIGKLKRLETLDLMRSPTISDDGIATLHPLDNLIQLRLIGMGITDDGIRPLASLTKLESMDIRMTQITDSSIPVLVGFQNLKWLVIDHTQITNTGLLKLASALNLNHIEFSLGNGITLEGAREFQRAAPNCLINCTEWYPDGTGQRIDVHTGEPILD